MTRFSVFLAALVTVSAGFGAHAQDPGQIESVRNGAKSCTGCNLFQADFAYQSITDANLSGSRLRQGDMTAATMDRTNFSGANLSVVEAFGGRFTRASFANAHLSDASFVGAYLGYANFAGARMSGAVISGANLEGARGLTQAQLNEACGDSGTILPSGLRVPYCG